MRTIPIPSRAPGAPIESKRLLALASDERLVARVRRGSDLAFEVLFERHAPGILSFCRHMLGSREEAEDAVQHTFAAAYRALHRDEREISVKPWLYTIARNRSLSLLRVRRDEVEGEGDLPTEGLAEQVEKRAELRALLRDLQELPVQQRAALLLAEVGDLAHAEVAGVLGCEVEQVKSLVFQARSGLIQRRQARDASCAEIRRQLATLRGGALRRNELRHHLRHCAGCTAFREEVIRQRGMLAAALPVLPSLKLKSSVLAAVGIGGGSAAGGGAAGVAGGALAKVAIAGAIAGGGAAAGTAIVERSERPPAAERAARAQPGGPAAENAPAADTLSVTDQGRPATARSGHRMPAERRGGSDAHVRGAPNRRRKNRAAGQGDLKRAAGQGGPNRGRGQGGGSNRAGERAAAPGAAGMDRGQGERAERAGLPQPEGRGPVDRPPQSTPVKRGAPETPPAPDRAGEPAARAVPAEPAEGSPPAPPAAGTTPAAPEQSQRSSSLP